MAKAPSRDKGKHQDNPIPDEVNEVIRRALRTPPKPQSEVLKERQHKSKPPRRKEGKS